MADGSVTIKVDMDSSDAKSGVSKLKALFGGLESASSKAGSSNSLSVFFRSGAAR